MRGIFCRGEFYFFGSWLLCARYSRMAYSRAAFAVAKTGGNDSYSMYEAAARGLPASPPPIA